MARSARCGSLAYPDSGPRLVLLPRSGLAAGCWLVAVDCWRSGNKKDDSNYHLIIKNACAHRINPQCVNCPAVLGPLMSLIAYQCSISIIWMGEFHGWADEMAELILMAVHQSVIDRSGATVSVSVAVAVDAVGGLPRLLFTDSCSHQWQLN